MSKPKSQNPPLSTPDAPQTSPAGCLVRLGWMLLGNIALLLSAAAISQNKAAFSLADALFWAIAIGVVALRYVDIRVLHGQTAMGTPATIAHWRRYAVFMAAASLGIWLLAHGVARITA